MGVRKDRIGEITTNRYGTICKIVEYNKYEDIIVEFQDDYKYHLHTTYGNFCNGELRNPYDKHICNVAYIGDGEYKIKDNNTHKNTDAYSRWSGIIHRCYDNNEHNKAYKDCTVSDEWKCYQNFARWYKDNYYCIDGEKMCIDKDILFKNNKLYSADTCIIVPEKINILFKNNVSSRGKYPIGVSNTDGYIRATCSDENGKSQYLGIFNSIDEAFIQYKNYKEKIIKRVADKYRDLIPIKLYEAMYKYEVDIND